jgi:hypothetical protein
MNRTEAIIRTNLAVPVVLSIKRIFMCVIAHEKAAGRMVDGQVDRRIFDLGQSYLYFKTNLVFVQAPFCFCCTIQHHLYMQEVDLLVMPIFRIHVSISSDTRHESNETLRS